MMMTPIAAQQQPSTSPKDLHQTMSYNSSNMHSSSTSATLAMSPARSTSSTRPPSQSQIPPSSSTQSSSTLQPATSSATSSTSSQHQNHHTAHVTYEERLAKLWRHLASSTVHFMTKAEKVAGEPSQATAKELDDSVIAFLRTRMEWHRLMSHMEAKLQGKAQEMEALECYVRTQPRLGKNKRKRQTEDWQEAAAAAETTLQNNNNTNNNNNGVEDSQDSNPTELFPPEGGSTTTVPPTAIPSEDLLDL